MENSKRKIQQFIKYYLRGGVKGLPGLVSGPLTVAVVHADGVNLFFVTFDAVWSANVVSEDPGLGG